MSALPFYVSEHALRLLFDPLVESARLGLGAHNIPTLRRRIVHEVPDLDVHELRVVAHTIEMLLEARGPLQENVVPMKRRLVSS